MARAAGEREFFLAWIESLGVTPSQERVLKALVEMAGVRELIDGRCAVVSYPDNVARRALVSEGFADVTRPLIREGLLTLHPVSAVGLDGPGVIFRVRRPDIELTIESAGPLWPQDAWTAVRYA
ncbi:hypothetical protein [Arthrobacter sp. MMS18-M83]|uniref:hypothetical protein n=1 Tax=Arthrobacter sp. MMS18-M83 TaxID=2996261 RepID=UPI00227CB8DC|nr:hypothetical protein [Arthrobacter sp. MMS18-M83]WAH99758.1 hypothetical protein OW521_23915 [Arthrobacter sp. MMS18-M83]